MDGHIEHNVISFFIKSSYSSTAQDNSSIKFGSYDAAGTDGSTFYVY
jgi:hypothetical protein